MRFCWWPTSRSVCKSTFSDSRAQVDGLEEYLNDPVKQHYLVRTLPAKMKRQLLYRRWLASLLSCVLLQLTATVILNGAFMCSLNQEIHLHISREPAEVGLHGSAAVWSRGEVQGERPGTRSPKTPHRENTSFSSDCCSDPIIFFVDYLIICTEIHKYLPDVWKRDKHARWMLSLIFFLLMFGVKVATKHAQFNMSKFTVELNN